jgi:DNA-binding ferritin-like protein
MPKAVRIEGKAITLDIVENAEMRKVAEALSQVLADTFSLYLKTHNFH